MNAEVLRAVRTWLNRQNDGDFRFVQSCLDGIRGTAAKHAAEAAVLAAVEAGDHEDDERIASFIVETVELDEERIVA